MKTATILIKTEPRLKQQAQKLAEQCGVSLSAVLSRSLQLFVDNRSITFSAEPELVPNAKTARALRRQIIEARAGKNMSPTFNTSEDAIAYLKGLCK
ncbi:TPA: hypothetical protein DEP96_02485 [Candidatus Uhrbacteria bacterium]|nr:hypothetical protein [Candidatus Uhrbacteria bacterium]